MNKSVMRFLSGVLVLCVCGISGAYAVPTVKRLGAGPTKVGSTATVVNAPTPTKPSSSSNPQRLGSVRSIGTTAPASTNRVSSGTITTDANRLGFKIGPYMQTGNTVKKISVNQPTEQQTEPTEPVIQNNLRAGDWIILEDDEISLNPVVVERITTLEELMPTKQNILTVGDGLSLIDDHLTLDLDSLVIPETTYTGTYGIAVDGDTHEVKVDIANPVEDAMYVFKNGVWTPLNVRKDWSLDW